MDVIEGNQLYEMPYVPLYTSERKGKVSLEGIGNNGKLMYIPLDEELLSRHLLVLGGIGTGKTNMLLSIMKQIKERMTSEDVMIVFDAKGEFYNAFYSPGDVVISADETATGDRGIDYWNVFNELKTSENLHETLNEICNSIFADAIKRTMQPFFPRAAKDLLYAIVLDFVRRGRESEGNEGLTKYLFTATVDEIKELLDRNEDCRAMKSYIWDMRAPQAMGVLSELQQHTRNIFLGNFNKRGTLSMRGLVREKGAKTIFIEYDLGIGKVLSPIYSLLYDLAIKESLCRNRSVGNVYFITDEFGLLPNLQHIEDAVNFGRALGVKFTLSLQNVNQIIEHYGRDRAQSMLSGLLTSVVFRVNDAESKQFISKLYGANRKSSSINKRFSGSGYPARVVEDWDIDALSLGKAIIGLPGREPFLFQFKKF